MEHKKLIRFFYESGKNASQIYDILKERYPDSYPRYSTITYHIRMNKLLWQHNKRLKNMKKLPNFRVMNIIRKEMEREPWHTPRSIEKETGIPKSTVHYHLTHYLGYHSVRTKYIPHMLTDDQKVKRVELAKELLHMLKLQKKKEYRYFVTGDESWFYYRVFPKRKWIKGNENGPQRPREKFDTKKVFVTIFWGIHGIQHLSALSKDDSYDSKYFCREVLGSLLNSELYRKAKEQKTKYVIHMDNSPVHNSSHTHFFIKDSGIARADHPPYSPDLATSDFWLFGALDNMKIDQSFDSPEDILDWIQEKFDTFSKGVIKSVFEDWERRLHRCIECGGDYIQ